MTGVDKAGAAITLAHDEAFARRSTKRACYHGAGVP